MKCRIASHVKNRLQLLDSFHSLICVVHNMMKYGDSLHNLNDTAYYCSLHSCYKNMLENAQLIYDYLLKHTREIKHKTKPCKTPIKCYQFL